MREKSAVKRPVLPRFRLLTEPRPVPSVGILLPTRNKKPPGTCKGFRAGRDMGGRTYLAAAAASAWAWSSAWRDSRVRLAGMFKALRASAVRSTTLESSK